MSDLRSDDATTVELAGTRPLTRHQVTLRLVAYRRWVCLTLALGVLLTLTATQIAGASSQPPRVPIYLGTPPTALSIRPTSIVYTGDDTGLLAGASRNGKIRWSSWTPQDAIGDGYNQLNTCNPNCAEGQFTGHQVKVEAWRPRELDGHLVFTRLTIWYKHEPPRGEPAHYTFTDVYGEVAAIAGGGYNWTPPSKQGYCVNTYGQPPAQGCRNINALP